MLTQIHSPLGGLGPIFDIAHDGAHVVAVGGQGRDLFLSSTDAGETFVQRASLGSGLRAAMVEGDEVWVCGEWGYLAHSADRGRTWDHFRQCLSNDPGPPETETCDEYGL